MKASKQVADALIGPTGRFPNGRVSVDDEGEFMIAIGIENGVVKLKFGSPVEWLGMTAAGATELGETLMRLALELRTDWTGG